MKHKKAYGKFVAYFFEYQIYMIITLFVGGSLYPFEFADNYQSYIADGFMQVNKPY